MAKPPSPIPPIPSIQPLLPPDSRLAREIGDVGRADAPLSRTSTTLPAATDSEAPARLPSHLTLARGQSFYAHVGRGTVIHIERGEVALTTAPHWLAASVWRGAVLLSTGQVHVAQTSGWLTLSADAGASVTLREHVAAVPGPAQRRASPSRLRQIIRSLFGA